MQVKVFPKAGIGSEVGDGGCEAVGREQVHPIKFPLSMKLYRMVEKVGITQVQDAFLCVMVRLPVCKTGKTNERDQQGPPYFA
jgi:hypothetical protein